MADPVEVAAREGLLAITVAQPYASLIAAGVKKWETRVGPPAGDMRPKGVTQQSGYRINRGDRIAIHAGRSWAPGWRDWLDVDDWRLNLLDNLGADLNEDVNGSLYCRVDRYSLPLGAIVATAVVADAVPIDPQAGHEHEAYEPPDDHIYTTIDGRALYRQQVIGDPSIASNVVPTDLTDQLPLGIWTPGRWAWLLTDVEPCAPIPATGRQGVWRWTPGGDRG